MKKTIIFTACLVISLFLHPGVSRAQAPSTDEKIQPDKAINIHRIVRINYSRAVGALIPEKVTAQPGSTIIWINESKGPVEIEFQGKQVTVACKNPVHFVINEEGSFISNRIPFGAVASLCFIESGTFDYVVRRAVSLKAAEGFQAIELGSEQELLKGEIIIRPEQE